nr:unnamed protein product [Callosobruchus analis]
MESTNEKKPRSRGSGRFGDEQKRLRVRQTYKSRKLKPVPEKAAPSQQVCCKCQLACKSLGYHWRKSLFEKFYKQNSHVQGSYLMNLIHLVPIRRRRHGSYENPEESKRQTTVNYTIPGESGDFVQVCKKTVMDTFAVTRKKIDSLVRDILKENTITSQQPGSDLCCLSMDLEQVLFVPTLVHSDMFYLSQLSCFNFGIHVGDTNHASMFLWHEGFSGRGANEIASCLIRFLNSGFTNKKTLVPWCDNCGGQNKNKFILFTLIFLVSIGLFDAIEQRFLVSGHSFMPCDRDFALIEKRKRTMKAYIPEDLIDVIKSARYNPPFEVIDMTQFCFWNIKEAADVYLNTSKLQISQAAAIRIAKQNPAMVKIKTTVSDLVPWEEVNVLKKGKTVSNIRNAELRVLSPENKISENKKKSLLSMIPYLKNPLHKKFYRDLLAVEAVAENDAGSNKN